MDDEQESVLEKIRGWKDPGPLKWNQWAAAYLAIVAGVVFVVFEVRGGGNVLEGAVGGFMIGIGLLGLLAFRLARQRRIAFLLLRQADESGAFAKRNEAGGATQGSVRRSSS